MHDHCQKLAVEFGEQSLTSNEVTFHAQQIVTFLVENYNLKSKDVVYLYVENDLPKVIGTKSIELAGAVCQSLSSPDSPPQNRLVLVDWLTQDKIKDNVITLSIDRMIHTGCKSSKNDEIRSIEPNLFQNTATKLCIPKINDDSIILLDEHENIIFRSKYSCSEIIHHIRDWDSLVELFADDLHADTICNDISRYITESIKKLTPYYTTQIMLKLCIYRQKYIDNLLQQLMDFFPYRLIIQNDSGSKDPESDYDIRIGSTDGSDADIDACMIFNEFFSQHWSLPSGIVFDTNLYPRHLNTVEPIFNVQGTGLGIFRTIRCDYPYYFFTEINDYKQNKMSMIKLRKSMTGKEWQDYINRITKADSSLREFFYRADTTYWKYTKKLLTQISKPNKLIRDTLNEIANIVPTIKTDRYDTTRFEYLWSKVHGRMRPALMEHSSILFISYLRQARNLEREIRNRKDRYDNSFLHPILCIPPNEMAYIDALTVSMRHKFSKAIYFANDACVAEGSMYYVSVEQYNNHVDVSYVKDKTLRTNLLTNNQLYQSMNEQYGNFLKYIKSYSNKQVHNGRTIYRSSKYLYRLVNTMIDLGANQWNRMGFDNDQHGKRLGLLVKECLLFIRKYKYPYNEMNSNDRAEISEYFALGIFPTDRQLQIFWEYRRSTLDRSSELYKYRSYTWE
ncbi:unnamed protein product, partial [Adineta ricciae]